MAERDPGRLVGPHIARVGAAMLQDIGHGARMGGQGAAADRRANSPAMPHMVSPTRAGEGAGTSARSVERGGLAVESLLISGG